MARRKTKNFTELELEIMQVVWNRGEVMVEDIRKELDEMGQPLALPSIRTMLSILMEKGAVERRAEGRRFAYRATISRDEAQKSILSEMVDRAFDGSALSLVAAILDTKMVPKRDLEKVKRLIEQSEKGEKE